MEPNKEKLIEIRNAAIKMALHCGEIHLASFRNRNLEMDTKSNVYDVVTKVDKMCEDYLIGEITRLFPDHSIIGEETGTHMHNSDWAWVVDPLDGTNSYSQGLPVFTVSIGVTYKGEETVGVVYAAYLDEMYVAVKGEGAYYSRPEHQGLEADDCNSFITKGDRIHVSSKTELGRCVLASGFPYDKATHPKNNLREVSKIVPQIRGFRRMGSAAYDLCCAAMGTIDTYWEYNLNPYDCCAGICIVREAGGVIVPICDDRKISIIAGPEVIVKQVQEQLLPFNNA